MHPYNYFSQKLCAAAIMLSATLAVEAASNLVVHYKSGQTSPQEFPMSEITRLTFADGKLGLNRTSGDATTIRLADIDRLTFDVKSGVEDVLPESSNAGLVYNRASALLSVAGITAETCLRIYSMSGATLLTIPNYAGEQVSVATLAPGIYVVAAGNNNFKFVK